MIAEGIKVMIFGMGIVFTFLFLLMILIYLLYKLDPILGKQEGKPVLETGGVAVPVDNVGAVISAAVSIYLKNRRG